MEAIKVIATLIAMLMVGCSVPGPVPFEQEENIDVVESNKQVTMKLVGFSPEEITVIESAAATWCETTGECIAFTEDAKIEFTVVDHTCSGGNFATTCRDNNNNTYAVQMIPRRERADWLNVLYNGALHEFGHVLGCWTHIPGANQMSSNWNELPGYPTEADIACVLNDGI